MVLIYIERNQNSVVPHNWILLLMAKILHQLRLVVYIVYPIYIHGFSTIPGGCCWGFQPSTTGTQKICSKNPLPRLHPTQKQLKLGNPTTSQQELSCLKNKAKGYLPESSQKSWGSAIGPCQFHKKIWQTPCLDSKKFRDISQDVRPQIMIPRKKPFK